jgi:hypothetical protein
MNAIVKKPTHYTSHPSGIEIKEMTRVLMTSEGNMFKYIARAGLKGDGLLDLQKAAEYNVISGEGEAPSVVMADTAKLAAFVAAEPNPLKATLFRLIAGQTYSGSRQETIGYLIDLLIEDAEVVAASVDAHNRERAEAILARSPPVRRSKRAQKHHQV